MGRPRLAARSVRVTPPTSRADVVHGTYNAGDGDLVFLAILSPAVFEGPALVDVSGEAPWASLRASRRRR